MVTSVKHDHIVQRFALQSIIGSRKYKDVLVLYCRKINKHFLTAYVKHDIAIVETDKDITW